MPLKFKGEPIASILFNNKLVKLFNFGTKSWSSFNDGWFTFTPIEGTSTCSAKFKKKLFNRYIKELTIPNKVTDKSGTEYSIIKIDDEGFATANVGKISIPNSVKLIGKSAFSGCGKLTTVTFEPGSQLRYLNSASFKDCKSLSTINLQEATKLKKIEAGAFYNCNSLVAIQLPQNITKIGEQAFYDCTSLKDITVPSKVRLIGTQAFYGCTKLEAAYILGMPAKLGSGVFSGCSKDITIYPNYIGALNNKTDLSLNSISTWGINEGEGKIDTVKLFQFEKVQDDEYQIKLNKEAPISGLDTIVIPEKYQNNQGTYYPIQTIAEGAFENCTTINKIIIPSSITSIADRAFKGCSGLTEISWGSSIQSIGDEAFFECAKLTSGDLSDSVESIGDYAFAGCSNLKSIEIPYRVTNIGSNAFANSNNLKVNLHLTSNIEENLGITALADCLANWLVKYEDDYEESGCGKLHYLRYYDNTIKITSGYEWYASDLEIPKTIDGCAVTSIGFCAFAGNTNITNVTIPNTVTNLGMMAFSNAAITGITIPDAVTNLGAYAFAHCKNLKEVVLGDGLTCIEPYTFVGCSALENLTIGSNITSLKEYAFGSNSTDVSKPVNIYIKNMTNWCEMTLGNGYSAPLNRFNSKSHSIYLNETLVESLSIPNDTIEICNRAFYNCTDLTKVTLGDSVFSIGVAAFDQCSNINHVVMNRNIAYISTKAFSPREQARTVEIPSLLNWLNINMALDGSPISNARDQVYLEGTLVESASTTITIPPEVTVIKAGVLDYWHIKQLNISENVTSISTNALRFLYTAGITVNSENEYYKSINDVLYSFDGGMLIKYPVLKENVTNWFGIPTMVLSVEDYAFYDCGTLTGISLDDNTCLESIGVYAFAKCINLEKVEIPSDNKTLKYINTGAFYHCEKLTQFVIPNSVTQIADYALAGCSWLQSITIGSSIKSIGDYAFEDCGSLANVYINTLANWCSVELCGCYSAPFANAKNLYIDGNVCGGELSIPDDVSQINNYTFYKCSILTSVMIPSSVESIGQYAFYGCNNLKSLELTNNNITIEDWAFGDCDNLDNITRPIDSQKPTVEACAFQDCTHEEALLTSLGTTRTPQKCADCGSTGTLHRIGNEYLCQSCYDNRQEQYEGDDEEYCEDYENSDAYGLGIGLTITGIIVLAIGGWCMWMVAQSIAVVGLTIVGCIALLAGVVMLIRGIALTSQGKAESTANDELTVHTVPALTCATAIAPEGFSQWKGSKVNFSGSGIKTLGPRSFAECPNLAEVYIPLSVTKIQKEAFIDCPKLVIKCEASSKPDTWDENWNPNNCLVIWDCAKNFTSHDYFAYKTLADGTVAIRTISTEVPSEINIPNASPDGRLVSAIDNNAFANYTNITRVNIPEGVTSIGQGAFSRCTNLIDINLPKSLTLIGQDAFYLCENLYSISIPDSVTSISKWAFRDCTSLSNVLIPSSVTSLGAGAFLCATDRDLTIYCEASEKPSGWSENWNITTVLDMALPDDTWDGTYFNIVWNCLATTSDDHFSYTLQNDNTYAVAVNTAGAYYQTWPVISIPSTHNDKPITAIADYGFSNCVSLSKIIIPDSILHIGRNAFQSCINLNNITLPSNLTSLGQATFMSCSDLKTIKIPDSVINYDTDSMFNGCSSLRDIALPQHWSTIGEYMFAGCASLEVISLPGQTRLIDSNAFSDCISLHGVYLEHKTWILSGESTSEDLDLGNSKDAAIAKYLVSDYVSSYWVARPPKAPSIDAKLNLNTTSISATIDNTNSQTYPVTVEITFLNNSMIVETVSQVITLIGMSQATLDLSINEVTAAFNKIELKAYFETGSETRVLFDIDSNFSYTSISTHEYSIKAIDPLKITEQELTIPSLFEGDYNITAIGDNAFNGAAITRVNLHTGITSIGKNAFSNTWLDDIHIPLSVTHVGADAFSGTSNMRVFCEVYRRPKTWATNWNTDVKEVTWRYSCTGEHSYQTSEIILPTCTSKGHTVHYCSLCNYPYRDTYVDALGHITSGWIIDIEPTSYTEGRKHKECTRCGEVLETYITASTGDIITTEQGEYLTDEQENLLII